MTVNHGVAGSSPAQGAKANRNLRLAFFVIIGLKCLYIFIFELKKYQPMKILFYTITFFITTNVLAQAVKIKDAYGNKVLYIDGNTLRAKDAYGNQLFYLDGQTIRSKDAYGEKLYYIDGQTLKYKDAYGSKVYYFEGIPEKWVIVCLIR